MAGPEGVDSKSPRKSKFLADSLPRLHASKSEVKFTSISIPKDVTVQKDGPDGSVEECSMLLGRG